MDAMVSYTKITITIKKRVIQFDCLCEDTVVVCGFINSDIFKGGGGGGLNIDPIQKIHANILKVLR